MTPDEIAQQIAKFVLAHEQNILDEVADFGLLLPMLEAVKESLSEQH